MIRKRNKARKAGKDVMRERFSRLFLIIFFFASSLAFLPSAFSLTSSIKIGVIGPETGEEAETGLATLAGVLFALENLNNAGGIDGKKVEVIHLDNKGNPQTTQAAVHKMIKEGVVAIISSPTGWSTFAPTWMANDARVIFMSAGSKRHIARGGPFIFRNALSDEIATEDVIRYVIKEFDYKNCSMITSMRDDETSLTIGGLYRRAVIKNGGRIVSETHLFMDATIEEAIAKLKKDAKGTIDAIIFAGDDAVAVDILKELKKQGVKAPIIGGDILYTENFLKDAKELAVGTIIYSGFFHEAKLPDVQKFVSEYKNKTGKKPTYYAASAYDSFMLIAEAIKTAKSLDTLKIRDALLQIKDFNALTGKTTMGRDRETIKKPFILQVVKGEKGIAFKEVGIK
ncbi:MAG: ABC transporter substrate-binding protein [Deltaproteobacteria bacterium]|nr:ABC transporter substrate-binding protein [Deltaproteobacteria bacterium]